MGKSKLTTSKERAAALRARLSGNAPSRISRSRVNLSSDPMFTATLHAAARSAKGMELSSLEERLVNALKVYATDEEVAEYGQIYTEMKSETRSLSGNSGALGGISLKLDEDTPYTEADMIKDAQNSQDEILARPENKFIDIDAVDAVNEDGCVDDEQYSAALLEADSNFNVSNATENNPTLFLDRRMKFIGLWQQRADGHDKNSFKTGEYGSIETGTVRSMGGLEYWTGSVQAHFAGHIECWEADDSDDGSLYNRMIRGLRDVAQYAIDAAVQATEAGDNGEGGWRKDDKGETGTGAAIMALSGLDAWTRRPSRELSFMFDGGSEGKHELWISCTPIPRPDGSLQALRSTNGGTWRIATPPTGSSPHGMSMVNHRGELIGVFRKSDNTMLWSKWSKSTGRWSAPIVINNGARSTHRPALCTFNNKSWCMYRNTNGHIYIMSTDNYTTWSSPINAGGGGLTSDGPSICGHNGKLYSVIRGNDNRTYWQDSSNGTSWSGYKQFSGNATIGSPSLCVHNGLPHVSILDINKKYYVSWFNNGKWSNFVNNAGSTMKSGPAAASYGTTLYTMWQGLNHHVTGIDRHNSGNPTQYNFGSLYATGDMGICVFEGDLWCVYGLAKF
ncbi:hypothetical protein EYC84_007323 [Monilinia fructicola]|uniref:Uncharacterized protein n=1 Tax=Monilinia fructicola TaxID=38448 RepID=A0A5M9JHS6_MONFR|nr:hypothetical protein EYC84_007323 [Monilinia fructicola]